MKFEAIVETGEVVVRELTAEEIKQDEIDRNAASNRQDIEDAKNEKKLAALAKLESLGLDVEDLKALGLG